MASVPESALATLTAEELAVVKPLLVTASEAAKQADRARMRLEGLKAALLDAEDALAAAFAPIAAKYGVDVTADLQLRDDGTLVRGGGQ